MDNETKALPLIEPGDTITMTGVVTRVHPARVMVKFPGSSSNVGVHYDAISGVIKIPRPFKSGDRASILDGTMEGIIVEVLHVVDDTAMVRYEDNSLGTEETSNLVRV